MLSVDRVVGANLRRVRETAGITQADLAARMTSLGTEWTSSNVSLVEAGKRKLTLTALADLCRVFNVKPPAFLGVASDGFFAPDDLAARLRALGGTDWSTTEAAPRLDTDDVAAAVSRQRQVDRLLWRISGGLDWYRIPGYGNAEPDEQRDLIRMTLEDLFPNQRGDVLLVRELLARDMAELNALETGVDPGAEDWARFRTAATRKLVTMLNDELGVTPEAPKVF